MPYLLDTRATVCYTTRTARLTGCAGGDRIGPTLVGLRYSGGDDPCSTEQTEVWRIYTSLARASVVEGNSTPH